jgi:hypothetical protein
LADDGIRAHNTLSAETTHVQVLYPFRPLHGATLQIVRRPKPADGAVSITDPTGLHNAVSGANIMQQKVTIGMKHFVS